MEEVAPGVEEVLRHASVSTGGPGTAHDVARRDLVDLLHVGVLMDPSAEILPVQFGLELLPSFSDPFLQRHTRQHYNIPVWAE